MESRSRCPRFWRAVLALAALRGLPNGIDQVARDAPRQRDVSAAFAKKRTSLPPDRERKGALAALPRTRLIKNLTKRGDAEEHGDDVDKESHSPG